MFLQGRLVRESSEGFKASQTIDFLRKEHDYKQETIDAAHDYLRNALDLINADKPYRFDYYMHS